MYKMLDIFDEFSTRCPICLMGNPVEIDDTDNPASSLDAASAESRVFMIPIILDFTLFHRGYLLLAK